MRQLAFFTTLGLLDADKYAMAAYAIARELHSNGAIGDDEMAECETCCREAQNAIRTLSQIIDEGTRVPAMVQPMDLRISFGAA